MKRLPLKHPASTPMPAALRRDAGNPLALRHPASVPMPRELLSAPRPRTEVGSRRVAVAKSPYAVRAEGKGQLVELVDFLRHVRAQVQDGGALTDAVADGTLWGWRARLALSNCLGVPLANWDREPGRTQLERLALVERALAECGHSDNHRGGWRVGDGRP